MRWTISTHTWTWVTIPLAIACLLLGLSLTQSIDQSRTESDRLGVSLRRVEDIVAQLERWKAADGAPEVRAQLERTLRLHRKVDQTIPAELIERTIASLETPPLPPDLQRGWLRQSGDLHRRTVLALSGPIDKWISAALLSMVGCMACIVLLLLQRVHRHQIQDSQINLDRVRESETRFREQFQHAAEGLFQADATGGIVAANDSLLKMLGYESLQELRSAGAPECGVLIQELLRARSLTNREIKLPLRNGPATLLLSGRAVDGSAGLIRCEAAVVDITEQRQLKEQAQAYRKQLEKTIRSLEEQSEQLVEQSLEIAAARDLAMESARRRSELLAAAVCEIQTPLRNILSISKRLVERPPDPAGSEHLTRASQSVLAALDGILDFAQVEIGRIEFAAEPFSLEEVIESVVEQWAGKADQKGLEMPCRLGRDVPGLLCGDAGRLRQVLSNLVGNAVRSTDSGEVALQIHRVSQTDQSVILRFEIEDNGPGVSSPSSALDDLAMATASHLVTRMEGQIGADREPAQGSLVWFVLPFARVAARPRAEPSLESLPGKRVLIVEDTASVRGALAEALGSWGMRTVTAETREQALQALGEAGRPFDYAVIDYDLPATSGLDLVEYLLESHPGSRSKAILLIPYSLRHWRHEPVLEGLHAILSKPVLPWNLRQALVAGAPREASEDLAALQQHFARSTTFSPLPAAISDARQTPTSEDHAVNAAQRAQAAPRVLIVDDNSANRKVALRLMQKMALEAKAVTNAEQAIEACRQHQYSIILMDCEMPGVDGIEATRVIRGLPMPAQPVIIAMTANAMPGDRERCLRAGMNDYLSKPVTLEQLRAAINRWT